MDHANCQWIILGMASGIVSLCGALVRIFLFYKAESEGRLKDAKELNKLIGEDN